MKRTKSDQTRKRNKAAAKYGVRRRFSSPDQKVLTRPLQTEKIKEGEWWRFSLAARRLRPERHQLEITKTTHGEKIPRKEKKKDETK